MYIYIFKEIHCLIYLVFDWKNCWGTNIHLVILNAIMIFFLLILKNLSHHWQQYNSWILITLLEKSTCLVMDLSLELEQKKNKFNHIIIKSKHFKFLIYIIICSIIHTVLFRYKNLNVQKTLNCLFCLKTSISVKKKRQL